MKIDLINFSDEKYSYVTNGHWGNGAIRNYVWGCIYLKDSENNELQFSRSPQLAVGVDDYAVRFGFFFGDNILDTDPTISEVKRDNELLGEILSAVNMNPNISFVSQSEISEIFVENEELFFGKISKSKNQSSNINFFILIN